MMCNSFFIVIGKPTLEHASTCRLRKLLVLRHFFVEIFKIDFFSLFLCQLFSQLYLDETLGLIRLGSLSYDRKTALVKLDYELQTLADQEHQAVEVEKTTRELLKQAESHSGSACVSARDTCRTR